MYGYLVAETGSLTQRPLALLVSAEPDDVETRLVQRLEREKPSAVRLWAESRPLPAGSLSKLKLERTSSAASLLDGASGVIVLGPTLLGLEPGALTSRHTPVAVTRESRGGVWPTNAVSLRRELGDDERARRDAALARERFRGLWIVGISLLVTVFGITNAMLMSVTERFRDIGTMKCLGATSRFIRQIFLLEASVMGLVGGALGVALGLSVSCATCFALYDAALVLRTVRAELGALLLASAEGLLAALLLTVVAALYPARFAARMVPADALRSNV
jgi:hypothetical protein